MLGKANFASRNKQSKLDIQKLIPLSSIQMYISWLHYMPKRAGTDYTDHMHTCSFFDSCCTKLHCTERCIILSCTALYITVMNRAVLHWTKVQCSLHSNKLYCIAQHHALHCTILHSIYPALHLSPSRTPIMSGHLVICSLLSYLPIVIKIDSPHLL